MLQQRLDFGAEEQLAAHLNVIERLDAQMIPRQEQLAPDRIPDGEREHAVEPFHAGRAPLFVGVNDHLRVRLRPERVPGLEEFLAQFDVIVDLPVENDLDAPVLVADGLRAAANIDDAQPPVAQARLTVHQFAVAVRAAVPDGGIHPAQQLPVDGFAVQVKDAANAAHNKSATVRRGIGPAVRSKPFNLPPIPPFNITR